MPTKALREALRGLRTHFRWVFSDHPISCPKHHFPHVASVGHSYPGCSLTDRMGLMAEQIKAFKQDYFDECAHLLVSTFNAEPWNDQWTLDTAKQELTWTTKVPGFVGLVSLDEEVLAFATGYRESDDRREVFYLKTFCVRPDAQGTGVGSRLIEMLKEHLEQNGVNTIYLITHKGTPAESFYRKHGYKVNPEDIVMTYEC
jgi:aminoglycoside 6'-N-acetyltransferase I